MPDDRTPAVRLEQFTVRYGSFTAVDRVSFRMPPGACGLLGRNGAGKSSILKAVLGLVPAAGGRAEILGLDARRDGRLLRDRIGYMAERETLLPGLSGYEAVVLAGRLSGLPALEARQRAHELLFLAGIEEERYRPAGTYSAGLKQRLKLAQALVHDPELLFLDEPTNGLDPNGRAEILDLLRALVRSHGKSLILSSHILPDVEALCDYVVLIDEGRVLEEGPIAALTAAAARVYRLRAHGARGLAAALREAGWLEEELEDGGFRLLLPAGAGTEQVFALVARCGGQVRLFDLERKSLADVFLSALKPDAAQAEAG